MVAETSVFPEAMCGMSALWFIEEFAWYFATYISFSCFPCCSY